MVAALSFMIAFPVEGIPPRERLELFMARSPFLQFKADALFKGGSGETPFKIEYAKERMDGQRLQVAWGGLSYEWRQRGRDAIYLMGPDKLYSEFAGLPAIVPPPPDVEQFLTSSFPSYLGTSKNSLWGQPGVKSEANKMTAVFEGDAGRATHTITLDAQGRPEVYTAVIEGMAAYELTIKFRSVEHSRPDPSLFIIQPPTGWMPQEIKERIPIQIGAPAPTASFEDTASGRTRTLKEFSAKPGTIFIFTASDCPASAALRKDLPSLLPLLKKNGFRIVEVALGTSRPAAISGLELVGDGKGQLESLLGIPSTPYLLTFDPTMRVRAAYGSYGPGEKDSLVKSVTTLSEIEE